MVNPSRSPSSRPPVPTDPPQPSSVPLQTPLPSIRQLHPYLPRTGTMSQQSQHEGTSYGSLHSTHHPSAPSRFETQDVYGHAPDTDNDDTDTQGPPKKKRRRQALSCTECKRRKIKCDRNQPCAPCTRRGEQAKCQWHVVEPIRLMSRSAPSSSSFSEKYVSRAEYDELKLRFEHLENTVHRFMGINSGGFGSGSVGHGAPLVIPAAAGPDYQSGNQGPSTGYAGTTIGEQPGQSQSFSATARPTPPTHRSSTTFDIKKSPSQQMMPPPKLLNQSSTASTYEPLSAHHQQLQHEALGPGSPPLFSSRRSQTHSRQRSRSSVGSASSMRSPMIPHSSGGTSATNSPAQQYRSLPNESPLLSAASPSIMKNSPLSLASITSPFDSEPGLLSRSGGVMPSDSEQTSRFSDAQSAKKLLRADVQAGRTSAQVHPRLPTPPHAQHIHQYPTYASHAPRSHDPYINPPLPSSSIHNRGAVGREIDHPDSNVGSSRPNRGRFSISSYTVTVPSTEPLLLHAQTSGTSQSRILEAGELDPASPGTHSLPSSVSMRSLEDRDSIGPARSGSNASGGGSTTGSVSSPPGR
ncbi:hypothetical protein FB446DRAFT_842012 [Lentinula raphanica]|nr:hypothetical protein FB446DRAFT_842012 [Lentinula raphanica]